LRINAKQNKRSKYQIKSALQEVEEQTNYDIVQIAFNSLKERVVLQKFKAISGNCYRLKQLRKYFFALEAHTLNKKIERNACLEIKKIQEAKYLWHWRKLFIKQQEGNQAREYMDGDKTYQIL